LILALGAFTSELIYCKNKITTSEVAKGCKNNNY